MIALDIPTGILEMHSQDITTKNDGDKYSPSTTSKSLENTWKVSFKEILGM